VGGLVEVGEVGSFVGGFVGGFVGNFVGSSVGNLVGGFVGVFVGSFVGSKVGIFVGNLVGSFVGDRVGGFVGSLVGDLVGGDGRQTVRDRSVRLKAANSFIYAEVGILSRLGGHAPLLSSSATMVASLLLLMPSRYEPKSPRLSPTT
jgi:hypothetical protein